MIQERKVLGKKKKKKKRSDQVAVPKKIKGLESSRKTHRITRNQKSIMLLFALQRECRSLWSVGLIS